MNNNPNGLGTEKWSDDAIYTGSYKDAKKTGLGCYQWIDGSSYYGNWLNNVLNGFVNYN